VMMGWQLDVASVAETMVVDDPKELHGYG